MNQGVLPVVLFPLDKTPFKHMRDVKISNCFQKSKKKWVTCRETDIDLLFFMCCLR